MTENVSTLINAVHYFRIPVNDLEDSVKWYEKYLGFKLRHRNEELAVFELNEGPLLTLVKADINSRGHFTINGQVEFSIGFTSPDLIQLREHLLQQEVQVDDIQEDDGHYYFHFYDPSGNKLQAHW